MGANREPLRRAEGLGRELVAGLALAALAWWVADPLGAWLGLSGQQWLAAALAVPVIHQLVAGAGWRLELFDRWFTHRFGDRALRVFGAAFFPLFGLRPVTLIGLSVADAGTAWEPGAVAFVVAAVVAAPAVWTFLSVARFFGARRALGADHFVPDFDEPFVRRGAFAVVPNAMYVFGFLLLWAIAIAAGSRAGLITAGFQHAFIWAHYLWVERPDIEVIYGDRRLSGGGAPGGGP